MKVTGFSLKKSTQGTSLAYGKIVLDNIIEVDVSIMNGKNGLFVSYPSKKGKDERWYPQFKIIDRTVSDEIQAQVIAHYESQVKNL
ncbi:MAG: septation protein SpoVG family protein [Bacteriovoracaceae bacterium]|nr:septation protein SpoVG family protein [Bacteriovoracaceae bacterium]